MEARAYSTNSGCVTFTVPKRACPGGNRKHLKMFADLADGQRPKLLQQLYYDEQEGRHCHFVTHHDTQVLKILLHELWIPSEGTGVVDLAATAGKWGYGRVTQ